MYIYFSKSFRGSKSAITMRLVSIETTVLLFLPVCNFLQGTKMLCRTCFRKQLSDKFPEIYLTETGNSDIKKANCNTTLKVVFLLSIFKTFPKPLHRHSGQLHA